MRIPGVVELNDTLPRLCVGTVAELAVADCLARERWGLWAVDGLHRQCQVRLRGYRGENSGILVVGARESLCCASGPRRRLLLEDGAIQGLRLPERNGSEE